MGKTRALVVLTPYESRRVIAKAVAKLPAVENAMQNGWIIVSTGTSTGYVAEELLGEPMVKENFISGHITAGETWDTPKNPNYIFPVVFAQGEASVDDTRGRAQRVHGGRRLRSGRQCG